VEHTKEEKEFAQGVGLLNPDRQFRSKTRKDWEDIFDGTDACCTPVLTHPELERNGCEPRAAFNFSKMPSFNVSNDGWTVKTLKPGEGGESMLEDWLGWNNGRCYQIESGAFTMKEAAKL
jgi:alpha-methylacyl-CoA racemase